MVEIFKIIWKERKGTSFYSQDLLIGEIKFLVRNPF